MAKPNQPAPAFLRSILRYDPETGKLFWRERNTDVETGYHGGSIMGVGGYYAHRVIWAMCFDEWPDQIDHINGDRADNRLSNLRAVNDAGNKRNIKLRADNKSGTPGVWWAEHIGAWRAVINADGVRTHLGCFSTYEMARAARLNAQRRLGFSERHGT